MSRPLMRLLWGLSVAGWGLVASAIGASQQHAFFEVVVGPGANGPVWTTTCSNSGNASRDFIATVQGALVSANFGPGWAADPKFLTPGAAFQSWFQARLMRRGFSGVVPTVVPDSAHPGQFQLVVVGQPTPMVSIRGLDVFLASWAVAEVTKVPIAASPAARSRMALETASGVAIDPASFTSLMQHSEVQLEPELTSPPAGPASPSALAAVRAQLVQAGETALESACDAMAGAQTAVDVNLKLTAALTALAGQVRGDQSPVSVLENYSSPPASPAFYQVIVTGLDPYYAADVTVSSLMLPPEMGSSPMAVADFHTKYPSGSVRTKIDQGMADLRTALLARLGQSELLPAAGLPRFIGTTEQQAIAAQLGSSAEGRLIAAVAVNAGPAAGTLTYSVVYQPTVTGLSIAVSGDTVRELTGTLSYTRTWTRGEAATVSASLGTEEQSASAALVLPNGHPLPGATLIGEADAGIDRQEAVRLGTASGPLVTRQEITAGPKGTWQKNEPSGWTYGASLQAGVRRLSGSDPEAFLGAGPRVLTGPTATATQAFAYATPLPAPAAAPAAAVAASQRLAALRALGRGAHSFGAHLQESVFEPSGATGYETGSLEAFFQQDYGSIGQTNAYWEVRGTGEAMTNGAPRLDFARLGGGGFVSGMDNGELAGRTLAAGAIEGGWSAESLIPALPAGPPLDGLFLMTVVEYGRVGDQSNAGLEFNPKSGAVSLGAGVRLLTFGGSSSINSSFALGYAWSPQSIRRSGRFYVKAIVPFSP